MDNKTLKKKGISAVIWNIYGTLMKQGVTFVVSIFLARLLSPEDYGLVGMATVFVSLTQSFADFGLTNALIQRKNPTEVQFCTVFYINIILSLILMLIMMLSASFIGDYYHKPEVSNIARVISLNFIIHAINGVQNAQLTKALANKVKTIATVSSSIASGVVGIGLALAGFGVWALVYSSLVGSVVKTIYIWYKSRWRPSLLFDIREVKPLFAFGFNIFSMGMLSTIYEKIDVLIIGKIFSANILGLFYKAKSFSELVTKYAASSLAGVLFPVFSHIQDDKDKTIDISSKVMHLNQFLSFGLAGCLFVIGEDLLLFLFSDKWIDAVPYFRLLLLSSYGYSVRIVLFNILNGLGISKVTLTLDIITKILGLITIALGFIWGIEGYLWALVVTTFVTMLITFVVVDKIVNWRWWKQLVILAQYAVPAYTIAYLLYLYPPIVINSRVLGIIVYGMIFSLAYIGVLIVIKAQCLTLIKNLTKSALHKK